MDPWSSPTRMNFEQARSRLRVGQFTGRVVEPAAAGLCTTAAWRCQRALLVRHRTAAIGTIASAGFRITLSSASDAPAPDFLRPGPIMISGADLSTYRVRCGRTEWVYLRSTTPTWPAGQENVIDSQSAEIHAAHMYCPGLALVAHLKLQQAVLWHRRGQIIAGD